MSDGGPFLISYITLRRIVGILGVLLPLLVAIGCLVLGDCDTIRSSISSYHGTGMRDVFVGILFTVGWFLFAYRGYDRRDNVAGNLACVFALGVALFPYDGAPPVGALHWLSAAALFLVLAYFSLRLFTKTKPDVEPTPEKLKRNRVYRVCGWVMLACIALIPVYKAFPERAPLASLSPVFWLEALALWAFGISWMTKGEIVWQDARSGG